MPQKNQHGLTPQQERFAQLVGASGMTFAAAYRSAYPKSRAWKEAALYPKASALAALDKVSARIAAFQAQAAAEAGLDRNRVLQELAKLVHSDIAGIIGPDGRTLLPNELDEATRPAVSSFKIDEYGRIEYKFWDKKGAIDMAMKHLGLYEVDNKQKNQAAAEFLASLQSNVIGPVRDPGDDDAD